MSDEVLSDRQARELKKNAAPSVAEALSAARSSEAPEAVLRHLIAMGQQRYGVDPDRPGFLIRIDPDGTRTTGRFIDRVFVPATRKDD